jgi:hypothetical protein
MTLLSCFRSAAPLEPNPEKRVRRAETSSLEQTAEVALRVASPGSSAQAGSASASSTGLAPELLPLVAQGLGTATSPPELDAPGERVETSFAEATSGAPEQGAQAGPRVDPLAQTGVPGSPGPTAQERVVTTEAPLAPTVEVVVDPSAARTSSSAPTPTAVVAPTSAPVRAPIAALGPSSSQARGSPSSGVPDCVSRVIMVRACRLPFTRSPL